MAFQPIIDIEDQSIYAYEALVRGVNQEPAQSILGRATDSNRYCLDHECRSKAIQLASDLGLAETNASLSINFRPNSIDNPASCIACTLQAAALRNFPAERLIFEITEGERLHDHARLNAVIGEYRAQGLRIAIDDFGSGYAGLNLLANFQPDILKIDQELVRKVDAHIAPRVIIQAIMTACQSLGIQVIAEGVETCHQLQALRDLGIRYFQGFYFARPGFEHLPAWGN